MTQTLRLFCIEGKDFLDQHEAAHYMCMSRSKFKQLVEGGNVQALNNHGKLVYRKTDLTKIIEQQNE